MTLRTRMPERDPTPSHDGSEAQGLQAASDTRAPMRLGWGVLLLGLGGFAAWAAFAPLDEGVSVPATVIVDGKRRPIQHLTGGVVRALKVRESQWVTEGQVLLELEEASARAAMESVRQVYMAQRSAESRLLSEQAGLPQVRFHPDLTSSEGDPTVLQQVATQRELFNARRAALGAELSGLKDSVAGVRAQIAGYVAMLASSRAQEALLQQQLLGLRSLVEQGYAPRNQLLQLEQSKAALESSMAELASNQQRAEQQVNELTARMAQRRQEFQREVGTALAEVQREVNAGRDRLRATNDELQRVEVKAPVSGQVVGLSVGALGAVVTPGQRLMDLLPKGQPLMLEARIPTHVIDRVKPGSATEVRFANFADAPQLVASARLASISEDAIVDMQQPGAAPFYLGRIEITADGMKALEARVVQPGMPAEVLIKTGERTLLTYLLHPLTRRISAAMREP